MECMKEVFPVILYILLCILVICLIVLVIRAIKTLNKVNIMVEDVNTKVNKLNGVFNIIDSTADAVSLVGDKVVNFFSSGISSIFHRKKGGKKDA